LGEEEAPRRRALSEDSEPDGDLRHSDADVDDEENESDEAVPEANYCVNILLRVHWLQKVPGELFAR
jgi:hypothetical protein